MGPGSKSGEINMRENFAGRILNDPSVRDWVKVTHRQCLERDSVDALEYAKLLTAMLQERMEDTLERAEIIARMLKLKGGY
jgi:hypothetical protein